MNERRTRFGTLHVYCCDKPLHGPYDLLYRSPHVPKWATIITKITTSKSRMPGVTATGNVGLVECTVDSKIEKIPYGFCVHNMTKITILTYFHLLAGHSTRANHIIKSRNATVKPTYSNRTYESVLVGYVVGKF